MSKVTRIYYSKNLTKYKLIQLKTLATKLGMFRSDIYHKYASTQFLLTDHREVRNNLIATKAAPYLPARLWKETLRDSFSNINTYYESTKVKLINIIYRKFKDPKDRKFYTAKIKKRLWFEDKFLHRLFRKHFKHGRNHCYNQIILDTDAYTTFNHNNQTWLSVTCESKGKRLAIPLNTNYPVKGTIRLIVKDTQVEVHHTVDIEPDESCGDKILGVDKGYTEVFVDSEGHTHGEGLGQLLSLESDYLKKKYQRRNKLKAIARKNSLKAGNIRKHNLGRKKLNKRKATFNVKVLDVVCKAVHGVVAKAQSLATENLNFKGKNTRSKDMNRRLCSWVKGMIATKLKEISQRRGASLHVVNAAYTSQVCSQCGAFGQRRGDSFNCTECGVVMKADHNAAINILERSYDSDIRLYDSPVRVKKVLIDRYSQRLTLRNQDSSCGLSGPSTESESLKLYAVGNYE